MSGRGGLPDIESDPFHEREPHEFRWRSRVLGAIVEFSSNRRDLIELAKHAFADVPSHCLGKLPPRLAVRLEWTRKGAKAFPGLPPKPALTSGGGILCGHVDQHNFVIVHPATRTALVQMNAALLQHRALARYELLEFAVITLATRVQSLVSLHAACVSMGGRAALLLGQSGAGKTTLALRAARAGLDLLSEDSVFVDRRSFRAMGLAAFVHVHDGSLNTFDDRRLIAALRRAPHIVRRSGARKRELDVRRGFLRLAPSAPRIVAIVLLSRRPAKAHAPRRLRPLELRSILRAEQSFAVGQAGWHEFEDRAARTSAFVLDRLSPADTVEALRDILAGVEG